MNSKNPIDLFYAMGLQPEAAIAYFKAKGYELTWDWFEMWQEAHAEAFTVAKVLRMDVLQDIRESVQKSLVEGLPLSQFKKDLMPKLARRGWGPEGVDPETLQLADPRRLRTIYETNMQVAYSAGRYKAAIKNIDNRPYWQYVAVMDDRTRIEHGALNGQVFRYDDPFWNSFYPPNGFRCRCRVRTLDQEDIKDRGLFIETSKGKLDKVEKLVSVKTGELIDVTQYTDPLTGIKISPDVGWDYNPGKAAYKPDLKKYDKDIRNL